MIFPGRKCQTGSVEDKPYIVNFLKVSGDLLLVLHVKGWGTIEQDEEDERQRIASG